MIPVSTCFTGIGIFAWKRKKPMWFWSGSTVNENEISDIPAYNRANGIMWLAFSAVFWLGAFVGLMQIEAAGIIVALGNLVGIPALVIVYKKIYSKYRIVR